MATAPKFRIDVDIHNLLMNSPAAFVPGGAELAVLTTRSAGLRRRGGIANARAAAILRGDGAARALANCKCSDENTAWLSPPFSRCDSVPKNEQALEPRCRRRECPVSQDF